MSRKLDSSISVDHSYHSLSIYLSLKSQHSPAGGGRSFQVGNIQSKKIRGHESPLEPAHSPTQNLCATNENQSQSAKPPLVGEAICFSWSPIAGRSLCSRHEVHHRHSPQSTGLDEQLRDGPEDQNRMPQRISGCWQIWYLTYVFSHEKRSYYGLKLIRVHLQCCGSFMPPQCMET